MSAIQEDIRFTGEKIRTRYVLVDVDPTLPDTSTQYQDAVLAHFVHQVLDCADQQRLELINEMRSLGVLDREDEIDPATFNGSSERVRQHIALVIEERRRVSALEDNAELDATRVELHYAHILDQIADRYDLVDQNHTLTMDERVKVRLSRFDGVQIVSDVDKTITAGDSFLGRLPGSILAEETMAHPDNGRRVFPLMLVRYWSEPLIHPSTRGIFQRVGRDMPIREGAKLFFNRTKELGIPVTLVSANFRPVVDGVKENLPPGAIDTTYAVDPDDIFSTKKQAIVREAAGKSPNLAVVYIGDGASDFPAMSEEARKVVAVYFALKDGDFAKQLEKEGLPYYPYETFDDITETLVRLGVFDEYE